jgi:hypothetical protein
MGIVWELYATCMGSVCELFRNCFGIVWVSYENCVGGAWQDLGKCMGIQQELIKPVWEWYADFIVFVWWNSLV